MDFSAIPAYLTKVYWAIRGTCVRCHHAIFVPQNNPGPDTAALLVTFHPPNASRVVPSLFLSPRVEKYVILADTNSIKCTARTLSLRYIVFVIGSTCICIQHYLLYKPFHTGKCCGTLGLYDMFMWTVLLHCPPGCWAGLAPYGCPPGEERMAPT